MIPAAVSPISTSRLKNHLWCLECKRSKNKGQSFNSINFIVLYKITSIHFHIKKKHLRILHQSKLDALFFNIGVLWLETSKPDSEMVTTSIFF